MLRAFRPSCENEVRRRRQMPTSAAKSLVQGHADERHRVRLLLTTQTQALDQIAVAAEVFALQVVEQLAALVHHADQATT